MKNKLLFLALILNSFFAQESFAVPEGKDFIDLNEIRDGNKLFYCTVDKQVNVCFSFNKKSDKIFGILYIPLYMEDVTCFYGKISKQYPHILVGTGYESATQGDKYTRLDFRDDRISDDVIFNYKSFAVVNNGEAVKFYNATINFEALNESLVEVKKNSGLYKKYNYKNENENLCPKINKF